MPEYLAPGVYVEEVSFRSKSIEGVSTSTTAFVGVTRKGPTSGAPELITSFGDFERIYGGLNDISFGSNRITNYLAHGVKNYFDNGGARLFVARVFVTDGSTTGIAGSSLIGDGSDTDDQFRFTARSPGAEGNGSVALSVNETDVSSAAITAPALVRAPNGSLLDDGGTVYIKSNGIWLDASDVAFTGPAGGSAVLVTLNVLTIDANGDQVFYENMGFGSEHPNYVANTLSSTPVRRIDQLQNNYAIELGSSVDGFRLYSIVNTDLGSNSSVSYSLTGGNDGGMPAGSNYVDPLLLHASNDDISIVSAPGYSAYTDRVGIQNEILTHVEQRKAYRIAVLDVPIDQTVTEAVGVKSSIDSSYAALYHPWIVVSNPLARPNDSSIPNEVALPPSGFVCGIYARNDNTKGVAKSPGNEVVRGAIRFQTEISFAEQEILNPKGVNCLRFFPGRGNRLWGARTTTSDPEWKYVGPRRYFLYLERSIDRSTQWAVFENNGPQLWANVRETVSSFLYNEWRSNALLGSTPEEAFFVRCDRTTMTQNDLDNGRMICLIGVSVLKPAEFVVFRIGQKTMDAR